ncbi:MAG: thiol peroxidase [Planctomycetota bacterium]
MKTVAWLSVLVLAGCAAEARKCESCRCSPAERPDAVTAQGHPLTLLGRTPLVGEPAPDFDAVDGEFKPVRLHDFRGEAVLIAAVPSLDTGVCAKETKRFFEEAKALPKNATILTVSMDLPFAQKRFCEQEKMEGARVLSDCVSRSFGLSYGVLIKDRGLLARSIFVVSRSGEIVYEEIVPELSHEPNYEAALSALKKAAGEP